MSVHPGWRAPVPPAYLHDGGRKDAPQAVQAFFYDRIGELISALELMRESPDILNEAWRKLNERDSSPSDSQALGIGDHQLAKNL
jgi:hypothetical protein